MHILSDVESVTLIRQGKERPSFGRCDKDSPSLRSPPAGFGCVIPTRKGQALPGGQTFANCAKILNSCSALNFEIPLEFHLHGTEQMGRFAHWVHRVTRGAGVFILCGCSVV
jgi:hypothetical protein